MNGLGALLIHLVFVSGIVTVVVQRLRRKGPDALVAQLDRLFTALPTDRDELWVGLLRFQFLSVEMITEIAAEHGFSFANWDLDPPYPGVVFRRPVPTGEDGRP